MKKILFALLLITASLTNISIAQEKQDEMDTDRPNITETPATVKKGHFQYETDLIHRERKTNEQEKQKEWVYNQANLKFGLSESSDLQLVIQSYGKQTTTELRSGKTESSEGFGDLTVRFKQSLIKSKNEIFSMSVVPYLKIPTSTYSENQRYEGGIIVPMKITLPKEWELSFQLEADRLQDESGEGMHFQILQSVNLSHEIINKLKAYGESYYTFNLDDHHQNNFVDAALQLEVRKNLKLDGGLNYGIQKDAEKSIFLGVALRF